MNEVVIPTNYLEFRKRFLEVVSSKGLQLHSIQHRGLGPQGKPLFTDIVYNVINPNAPTLVHISGVHGTEGFIGSLAQTGIIADLKMEDTKDMNFVFVHALNPWGMAWYRRTNAQNVDLNRNYFPEGSVRPENKDFEDFAPFFEKKKPEVKRWKIWKQTLRAVFKHGIRRTIRIIGEGQYHLPDSLFYGGDQNESDITNTLYFVRAKLGLGPEIYVIDVHSGLGKYGSENWMLDGEQTPEELEFWQGVYDRVENPAENPRFYKASGTLSQAFRDQFKDRKIFYILEEFGTYSLYSVFSTLVKEHRMFLKLKLDRFRSYGMVSAFFPHQKDWRERSSAQARLSFLKLVDAIKSRRPLTGS